MQQLSLLYKSHFGAAPQSIERLPGAGSNRLYYRLTTDDGKTVIGVVGTSVEENKAFIAITRHFTSKGLPVPTLIAVSDDSLRYLQTDLGNASLFDEIKADDYSHLIDTIRLLPRLQFEGGNGFDFSVCYPQPEFDRDNVMFDLNYFKYCFLKATGVDFHELRLQRDMERFADQLVAMQTAAKASTFMYRDFQSRNVMIKDERPYFIDYQGGRKGPYYYDVASFVWQASAKYPHEVRTTLVNEYYDALQQYTDAEPKDMFLANLRKFVFFRTLQVLGAYGFRGYFERKKHFIDSIPAAIANLSELLSEGVCDDYRELKATLSSLINQFEQKEKDSHEKYNQVAPKANNPKPLVVRVNSFSFKKGIPQDESGNGGGYVFDCRSTHNPGRYEEYKQLTGLDAPVIKFLEDDGEITTFLESVYRLAEHHVERFMQRGFSDLMFSFGCTGGQHRSVYCAQHLAEFLNKKYGIRVLVSHIAQGKSFVLNEKS
ncbi:MAG: RNase adapter RapZ [Prevotellaceae bacterium]|nr:RNase adapter RapZ [Prevotellaceae bacterium]